MSSAVERAGRVRARRPMSSQSATIVALMVAGVAGSAMAISGSTIQWLDPIGVPKLIAGVSLVFAFMFFGVFVVARRPA